MPEEVKPTTADQCSPQEAERRSPNAAVTIRGQRRIATAEWLTLTVVSFGVITVGLYLLIYLLTGIWQMLVVAGGAAVVLACTFQARRWACRGRLDAAGYWLLACAALSYGAYEVAWSGMTLHILLGGIVVIGVMGYAALPRKLLAWLVASGLLGVCVWLVNRFEPLPRYDMTHSVIYRLHLIPAASFLIVLVLLWQSLSERRKVKAIGSHLRSALVAAVLATASAIGLFSVVVDFESGQQRAVQQLGSVAAFKETEIEGWVSDLQNNLALTLSEHQVSWVESLLEASPGSADYQAAYGYLQEEVSQLTETPLFEEAFLMDHQGRVVLSTDATQVGQDKNDRGYFREGLRRAYVQSPFHSPSLDRLSVVAARPVVGEQGHVLGVLVGRASMATLSDIIHEGVELGDTGEIYLVGPDHFLLTEFRSPPPDEGGEIYVYAEGVDAVLETHTSGSGLCENLRGVPVVGVYRWLPALQAVLVVEQPQSEALRPMVVGLFINATVTVIAMGLAVVVAMLVTRDIAVPLTELAETATQIALGDLELEAREDREDEIGALARAFNSMTGRLRELVGSLERQVAELQRAQEATRRYAEQLEALEEAAAVVSSTLDLDRVLDHILEQVERVVPGDAFNVMLVEGDAARVVRQRGYDVLGVASQSPDFAMQVADYPSLRKMMQTGEPLVIQDTILDPDWVVLEGRGWLLSYLGVPIQVGGVTVGFLNVNGTRPGQFDPDDVRRLEAFASHAATAIENARLFGETQRRVAELEALQRTGLQLTSSLDPSAVLDSIAASALTLVGADDCHIYLYDEATETFAFGTALWKGGKRDAAVSAPRSNGITATVVRGRQPIVINDAPTHPFYTTPEAQKWGVQAIAGFPLNRAGRVLGVFTIAFLRPHTFSQGELRVLELLANQAVIAIENAQLYRQLRDYAEQLEQRVRERTAQLAAQYARLEAILHSSSDGIVVTDVQGKILQTNPVARIWLTRSLSPEDADRLQEAMRDLAQHAEERPETVLELTGLDLELKAAPISEPEFTPTLDAGGMKRTPRSPQSEPAAVVAVHDVSELKALDRMRARFVTNISHELRTPVTTIKLYAALMQQNPQKWETYLAPLAQEADHQARLVQDILQISRIDTGRVEMDPKPTLLNELAQTIVANRQVLAREQGLTLGHHLAEQGPVALVDPERMMQVLDNLVTNAIRYTPAGRGVVVSTGMAEAEGRVWATATVADTGMGIPQEELPHVFERFFRGVKPRKMQVSGTGLGLAIVEEIVKLHGGRVTVESEVGVGSTFTVWLPLAD
jgi:signal transduction histidine kinase/putative methionine-R-sulfoxide reductase with GAF domain